MPPPPPPVGAHWAPCPTPDGCKNGTLPPWVPASAWYGWQQPNSSTADSFSAACWFFGQVTWPDFHHYFWLLWARSAYLRVEA